MRDSKRCSQMIESNCGLSVAENFSLSEAALVIANRVAEITTLPQVARRIMEITSDPEASSSELKEALEGDPALSARVLRLVNSSAVGLAHRIANLQRAVAYLGFRQIRNLAWTAFVADLFRNQEAIGRYRRSELWNHSIAVAILAKMIAMRHGRTDFEDVFLGGLLHDFGIILMDQYDHKRFRELVSHLRAGSTLETFERAYLGYTHCELGTAVGERWLLPVNCLEAIRWHHHSDPPVADKGLVFCVALANFLVTQKGMPSVGWQLVQPPVEAVKFFGLTRTDVEALLADFSEELVQQAGLFVLES
jgi:HD-like signal output (HDOD) protein